MVPEFIICEKCGEKTHPDHKPDPRWRSGFFKYECGCGWYTYVQLGGIDTVYMSRYTTTTRSSKVIE